MKITWASGKLYKLGKISTQIERSRKAERFYWRSAPCVQLGCLRLSFTLSIRTFRIIKGEKKQILFYTSALLSFSAIQHLPNCRVSSIPGKISSTTVFIFCPTNLFGLNLLCYGLVWTRKAKVRELDYVARSSVRLPNYTRSKTMHNRSAPQLPTAADTYPNMNCFSYVICRYQNITKHFTHSTKNQT